ncbi:Tn3 family transposase [Streptomyces sp. W16]|nr:Tn3 family transposase [Streptomyces sp. W16]MDV9168577.1 Tn3 family transposase [Streptomyces sp. W16]
MALFNQAVGWLRRHRVLLPGVSVLAKQVASVRQVAEKRLYATVAGAARRADASLSADLVALLGVPEGRRISELERLRRPPTRTTGASLAKALERVDEISAFRLGRVKLDKVPPNRLATLARVGLGSKAPILERTPEPKRTALLTSVVRHLEASAIDDALDLFSVLMQVKLISAARRATDRDWLAARPRMARSARMLDGVFRLWSEQLDLLTESGADLDAGAMWRALETEIGPREEVMAASALLGELIGPADEEAEAEMRRLLATRYNTVRPFLSLLGESPALGAASGGKRILEAVKRIPALARRKVKAKPLLPREIDAKLVPAAWKKAVYSNPDLPEGAVDRDAYAVCVLEQLFRALNRRDVFASPSNRWADPRARLLDGKQWEAVCEDVLHGLSLDEPVAEHLAGRVRALDAAWHLMAERLEEAGQDAKLSFEVQPNGRLKLNVDRLGALGESESLKWLRKTTAKMLPKIDLPDLLFEVDSWTGFLDAFVHLGDGRTRMENLKTSLVALLVSEACNIGYTPVIDADDEALTRARLVHVDQYYLRADTIFSELSGTVSFGQHEVQRGGSGRGPEVVRAPGRPKRLLPSSRHVGGDQAEDLARVSESVVMLEDPSDCVECLVQVRPGQGDLLVGDLPMGDDLVGVVAGGPCCCVESLDVDLDWILVQATRVRGEGEHVEAAYLNRFVFGCDLRVSEDACLVAGPVGHVRNLREPTETAGETRRPAVGVALAADPRALGGHVVPYEPVRDDGVELQVRTTRHPHVLDRVPDVAVVKERLDVSFRSVKVGAPLLPPDVIFPHVQRLGGESADTPGNLWEGWQPEIDCSGSSVLLGVELGELVLGGGEADAEPVDFAEPASAFGFGDARDEVDPDLVEGGQARLPSLGDLGRQGEGVDPGVVSLQVGPEVGCEDPGQPLERVVVHRGLALGQVVDDDVANRAAAQLVAVDQVADADLSGEGLQSAERGRDVGRELSGRSQPGVGQHRGVVPVLAGG